MQPGVTQHQLYEYLKKFGSKHMVPVTGAGVFGSILGNAIDRGYGITPYCDHFLSITEMKVVLADGQIIQTGLSRYGAKHSGRLFVGVLDHIKMVCMPKEISGWLLKLRFY